MLLEAAELFNKINVEDKKLTGVILSRLVYMIGHIAIRQLVHLDTVVYKELKRRNALRDKKKGTRSRKTFGRSILNSTDSTPSSASVTRRNKEVDKCLNFMNFMKLSLIEENIINRKF